jgi:hypothetical protein
MYNLQELSDIRDLKKHITKIIICADIPLIKDAILHLYRMNINRATLFPGLDGFSASLRSLNVVPEAVVSDGLIVGDEYSS